MRDNIMERFLVLPFSMACMSKSNAVESSQCKKQKPQPKQLVTRMQEGKGSSGMKLKNSWGLRRSNISRGIRRLILETLESFSRILNYYKEVEVEVEVEEIELEIGFPTDVKHVTHIGIGYDGSMVTNPVQNKNWDHHMETPEILSFPSISLTQFEHAMAAQSHTQCSSSITISMDPNH